MATKDVFAELNAAIKANEGIVPDRFTMGGETFVRVQQRPGDGPQKKLWKNPKTGKETEEDIETVLVNVAPHSDRIILDGVHYLANRTYEVPSRVAATMRDIIAQTWKHENATGGAYSYGAGAARNTRAAAPGVGYY